MIYERFRDKEHIKELLADIIAVLYCMDFAPAYFYDVQSISRSYTLHEMGGRNLSQISSDGNIVIKKHPSTSNKKNIMFDDSYVAMCYISGTEIMSVLDKDFAITEYEMQGLDYFDDEATWFQESITCNPDHLGARYFMSLLEDSPIRTLWVSLTYFDILIQDLKTHNRYDKIHEFYKLDRANRNRKTSL